MEDKHKIAINMYFEVINQVNGIEFVEFIKRDENTKRFVMEGGLIEQEVGKCDYPCQNIEDWITKILEEFKIQGEFLFLFEDKKRLRYTLHDIPKVRLSTTYEWVKPLWELGEHFTFMPLDKSYYLQILWEDSKCICVVVYSKDLPKLK